MSKIEQVSVSNSNISVTEEEHDPKTKIIREIVLSRLKPKADSSFVNWCTSKILNDRRVKKIPAKDVPKIQKLANRIIFCLDNTPIDLSHVQVSKDDKEIFDLLKNFILNDDGLNITKKLFDSMFSRTKRNVYSRTCAVIQKIFDEVFTQVNENKNSEFDKKADVMMSNIIALLPYFNPEKIESKQIRIPQLIEGKWNQVTFNIGRTALRPLSKIGNLISKMFGEAIDIVELDPIEDDKKIGARSIRSFQGTAFMAGKGTVQTLLADTFPGSSVGEMFLYFTKGAIKKSLNKSHTTEKIDLYGQSLGGAKALLVSLAYAEKVERVVTFGAPKLFSWSVNRLLSDLKKRKVTYTPKVTCFVNVNDSVPHAGNALPPGVKTIQVIGKKVHSKYHAHAKAVAGQDQVLMKKLSKHDVKGWSVTAVIHLVLAPILFTLIAAVFVVWRLLVTLLYTLPAAGIQAIINAVNKKQQVPVTA